MATTIPGFPNISSQVFGGLNIGSDHELRPMKTGKASGWGMNYTWIELGRAEDTPPDINDQALKWCIKQYGKSGVRWFEKDKKFYFKDEKDVTMFILRYS
jgi:hypothetical protein